MKEKVTNFDLEAAFKALDEIEMPKVKGLRPNRPDLKESTRRVDRLSMLVEDYYDLGNPDEVDAAKDDRDGEIAKAKLSKIEKIVDLDAETEDDINPSYVGKDIIQCPQCMILFYKDPADIEASDGDPKTVNVGEICQHCGNDSGYTLIGKVAEEEASAEELPAEEPAAEGEELPTEEPTAEEAPAEETSEEAPVEDELNLDEIPNEEAPAEEEPKEEEEEKKEEAFTRPTGDSLNEQIETALNEAAGSDLDKKLAEHNEYISTLQAEIAKEEEAIKNAKNDFIKKMHETNLENLRTALDQAIPEEVKEEIPAEVDEATGEDELPDLEDVPAEEIENKEEAPAEKAPTEEAKPEEIKTESLNEADCKVNKVITHSEEDAKELDEAEKLPELNDENLDKMFDDPEFNKPVSETEVENYLDDEKLSDDNFKKLEDLHESSFNSHITNFLTATYKNVNNFEATSCEIANNKLIVEGLINFNSGKTKETKFEFSIKERNILEGFNKDFSNNNSFLLEYFPEDNGTMLVTENLNYKFNVGKTLVEGYTRK